MDGKGRCFDNIYIERFWRTLKYEEIYLKSYSSVSELKFAVSEYINYYNNERPHQSLGYQTPYDVFMGSDNLYKFLSSDYANKEKEKSSLKCEITV